MSSLIQPVGRHCWIKQSSMADLSDVPEGSGWPGIMRNDLLFEMDLSYTDTGELQHIMRFGVNAQWITPIRIVAIDCVSLDIMWDPLNRVRSFCC